MDTLIPTGRPAPAFSLPDLAGRLHHLEEARGSILVINFWSAECPWAERADREILAHLPAWGGRLQYWAVASNANEPAALLRRVAETRTLPLVLRDDRHTVADLYHAQTTPHFFVVDRSGFLRYQGGYDDVTFRKRIAEEFYLPNAVEALLAGKIPDPAETPAYGCTIIRQA